MKFVETIKNKFKKPEPVPEKQPLTLAAAKLSVNKFKRSTGSIIGELQRKVKEKVQSAADKKMNGMDAAADIRMIARLKNKINSMERAVDHLDMILNDFESAEFERRFVESFGNIMNDLKNYSFNSEALNDMTTRIEDHAMQIAENQERMQNFMDNVDSIFEYSDSRSGIQLNDIESNIDAIITRAIEDEQFSATNTSVAEVARSVADKIKI